ncbi:hypothetical protein H7X64_02145 [Armatimonadetes bacterium]|nr:hypothetical protein [bacterium]
MKFFERGALGLRNYLQFDDLREIVIIPSNQIFSILSTTAESESATTLDLASTKGSELAKLDISNVGKDIGEDGIVDDITDEGNNIDAPIFQETFNKNGVKVETIELDEDNNFDIEEIIPGEEQPTSDVVMGENLKGMNIEDAILTQSDADDIYFNLENNQEEFLNQTAEDDTPQDEYDDSLYQAVKYQQRKNSNQVSEDRNIIEVVKQKKTMKTIKQSNSEQKRLTKKPSSTKPSSKMTSSKVASSKVPTSRELLLRDLYMKETSTRNQQIKKRKTAARNAKTRIKNQNRYIKLQSMIK